MTTNEIAKKLVELNNSNNMANIMELYSPDATSIENWGPEPEIYKGLDAIKEKGKKWMETVSEMHSFSCSEPLVADSSFAVTFTMDITYKSRGRENMTEMGMYSVENGKIIREEFRA